MAMIVGLLNKERARARGILASTLRLIPYHAQLFHDNRMALFIRTVHRSFHHAQIAEHKHVATRRLHYQAPNQANRSFDFAHVSPSSLETPFPAARYHPRR